MQANWDLTNARNAEMRAAMSPAELNSWLPNFPITELKNRGALPKTNDKAEIGVALLNFLEIGSFTSIEAKYGALAVQHRRARSSTASPAHIYAWLKLGENKAVEMDLPKYNERSFFDAVKEIRSLTIQEPEFFEPRMDELCRQAGVAFVLEKPISKTSLYGSARWISGETPIIQMSLRMKSNDHFWWTFFHEAAHILLHKGKNFADDKNGVGDGLEDEADAWAEEILVGKSNFYNFKINYPRSEAQIIDFADSIKIHPGIVVGMLQHAGVLPFTHLNKLKVRFDWAEEQVN
ncbi:MAG: hypothetical protein B0A82_23740 [Alkalinema sp. CACIAM 70d]|nr:MAG: hypothetical protein B0A82_23740 [Alkalinema sp. CACIAM 70d]